MLALQAKLSSVPSPVRWSFGRGLADRSNFSLKAGRYCNFAGTLGPSLYPPVSSRLTLQPAALAWRLTFKASRFLITTLIPPGPVCWNELKKMEPAQWAVSSTGNFKRFLPRQKRLRPDHVFPTPFPVG